MAGHVFITQGDLTRLACDAWLLPTDQNLRVEASWLTSAPAAVRAALEGRTLSVETPPRWGNMGVRAFRLTLWPSGPREPQPWLVNVGASSGTDPRWYAKGVREFLQAAGEHLHQLPSQPLQRATPLVALPLVGTGRGGAADMKGEIVDAVLDELYSAARRDIDIALVTSTPAALAAAQTARRDRERWSALDAEVIQHARYLAGEATKSKLVLFLGAGLSSAAGLPTWEALLERLAVDAKMEVCERQALSRLSILDRARLIEGRLQGRVELGESIKRHLHATHHSLSHSLIAALPVSEVVTTNYDTLFEEASRAIGRSIAVLPYENPNGLSRWLLKLHGSIEYPDDIVLTREDYLRYADRRAALAGIVQALLITRHMLFAGFSLSDDNFHRIADDVRKAIRHRGAVATKLEPFGTALFLERDGLVEELWKGDLNCVSLSSGTRNTDDAARRLEVFLDLLLAESTSNTAHLLDDSYVTILTESEREIRDALRTLMASVSAPAQTSAAWQPVAALLGTLGRRDPDRTDSARLPRLQRSSRSEPLRS